FELFYGSKKAEDVNLNLELPSVLGQAFSSNPLLFLGCSLKSDRTITVISRLAKKFSGTVHFALLSEGEMNTARIGQLYRWNVRPIYFSSGRYEKIEEFLACLGSAASSRKPISHTGPSRPKRHGRHSSRDLLRHARVPKRINGYKLCYYRMTRK